MFDETEMGEIESLLRERYVPARPRRPLAQQIIDHAVKQRQHQKPRFDVHDYWQAFWENFALPEPAFVMILALVIGMSFGAKGVVSDMMPDMTVQEMAYFMSVEDPQRGDMWL